MPVANAASRVAQKLDKGEWTGVPATVNAEVGASLLVNGRLPTSMSLHTKVRRVSQSVELASVVVYADPITAARGSTSMAAPRSLRIVIISP
jgi:hypothetical protein